jgi:hypothetical protein
MIDFGSIPWDDPDAPRLRCTKRRSTAQDAQMSGIRDWDAQVEALVSEAEEMLWSLKGEHALAYLARMGLALTTIRRARLGFIPGTVNDKHVLHGLNTPSGITIPWIDQGTIHAIRVVADTSKPFLMVEGSLLMPIYGSTSLTFDRPVVLCHDELDALLVRQETRQLVTAISCGGYGSYALERLVAFQLTSPLLVVCGSDPQDKKFARQLARESSMFRCADLPRGGSVAQFSCSGGDIYAWIEANLRAIGMRTNG